MNIKNQVIILSAELSDLSNEENLKRSINLGACLEDLGLNFSKVQGCYKGVKELSFMVIIKDQAEMYAIQDFAFKNFNQESILYQDANGLCHLEYQNGDSEVLGRFEQINPKYIETVDAYTVINNRVFTIR